MPFFNKTREVWVGQVRAAGQRYVESFPTKKEAKAWEATKKLELKKLQSSPTPTVSLYEFAKTYMDFVKQKYVHKTYNEKHIAFRLLLKSIEPTTPVDEVHHGIILEHLARQSINRSGNAANKDRKNLVAGWNWARKYIPNFPTENPFDVERFPEVRHHRRVPTIEEFYQVVEAVDNDQDRLLLYCYLHLGARKMEIYTLQWSDISFDEKRIRLSTRKRQHGSLEYNWLPLTDFIHRGLSQHLSQRINKWVFPDPKTKEPYAARNRWMNQLCKKAGVLPFGLHGIRHLSASILVSNDVPLIDIQTILRHKSIATTERYLHRLVSVTKSIEVFDKKATQKANTNKKRT